MIRLTNTDQAKGTDRQASGNQPDNSTPTGSSPTGVIPPGTGTVTSITAGTGLDGTPSNPITTAGTILHLDYGTPGDYQRVTTNAQGHVTAGENDVINVEQYGMSESNGAVANTTALNLAIAAMASYSTLYIPGFYEITAGSIGYIAGMDGITIMGDGFGSGLYSTATGAPGNFIEVDGTCQYVKLFAFRIVGAATMRGSGVGIRMYGSDAQISSMWVEGTSDFAMHIAGNAGGTAYSERVSVTNNHIKAPLGDGIHAGAVKDVLITGNLITATGDDSIALVADDASFPTLRATVVGNSIYNSGARGIAVLEAKYFLVSSNLINVTVLAPIELNRFNSTTAYCEQGEVIGNSMYGTTTSAGPIGAINLFFCKYVKCSDNRVDAPATGSGISYLDCLHVSITDNHLSNLPAYGIRGYDFGASHVAASQGPLTIKGNYIDTCVDYAVYAVADVGTTIFKLMVNENEGVSISGSNVVVFYDKINTGRVWNNTSFGSAVTAGGTVAAVTAGNNN